MNLLKYLHSINPFYRLITLTIFWFCGKLKVNCKIWKDISSCNVCRQIKRLLLFPETVLLIYFLGNEMFDMVVETIFTYFIEYLFQYFLTFWLSCDFIFWIYFSPMITHSVGVFNIRTNVFLCYFIFLQKM